MAIDPREIERVLDELPEVQRWAWWVGYVDGSMECCQDDGERAAATQRLEALELYLRQRGKWPMPPAVPDDPSSLG